MYGISYLVKPSVNLDQQVLNVALSDTISVVGYRNNTGNATTGFSYYFYVKSNKASLSSPFLISSTPKLNIEIKNDQSFSADITGKIYKFTNVIWVKEGSQLIPVNIELHTKNK